MEQVKDSARIGMSENDLKRWTWTGLLAGDPFIEECSKAVGDKIGKRPHGQFIPLDKLEHRDMTVGTDTAGGYTVATNLLSASYIEMLLDMLIVKPLGATIITSLVGDIAIPKQTGGATAYWVGESEAPTESQPTFGQVALSPKTVAMFTDFSRKLALQSSPAIEALIKQDIARQIARKIQDAAINGSGVGNEPRGILQTDGIGAVEGGTNGAAADWVDIVGLESQIAQDNADVGKLAYAVSTKVRGKLKQTLKNTNTETFIWQKDPQGRPGFGEINGYPAVASNSLPDDLTKGSSSGVCSAIIFGNWADLIIAQWTGLDVITDPYTHSSSGTIRVTAFQDIDIAIRHPESFAAMTDALTA